MNGPTYDPPMAHLHCSVCAVCYWGYLQRQKTKENLPYRTCLCVFRWDIRIHNGEGNVPLQSVPYK